MDSGNSTKPAAGPITAAPRPDPTASFRAVRTDLRPADTVQQAAPIEAVRFDPSDGLRERAILDQVLTRAVERRTELDERTKGLVYRVSDARTGEVVAQYPTEQILKLRAYLRDAAEPKATAGTVA
ncbi:flagellar protein FlaG [Salinarimonas soli]|uniref:Flagellar protein FlaG n=1 Tax=Salinarimonas soli TaxID=1638099 RepID=A0A5B2W0D7_9HYPH|nr:flagellar protein FlaG [Salinarimonas soli]KAA2244180.1 flagellar protein FlaG [Salinarimonas soli]